LWEYFGKHWRRLGFGFCENSDLCRPSLHSSDGPCCLQVYIHISFLTCFYEVREIIEERVLKAVDPLYHSARTKETTNMAIIRYGIRTVLVFCVVGITIGIPDFEDMVALGSFHHFYLIFGFNWK